MGAMFLPGSLLCSPAILRCSFRIVWEFYRFDQIDHRKISSSNTLERLNREIRKRSKVVGIFPNKDSYIRLITTYLIEYEEEW